MASKSIKLLGAEADTGAGAVARGLVFCVLRRLSLLNDKADNRITQ
jgi:hypothetical protein